MRAILLGLVATLGLAGAGHAQDRDREAAFTIGGDAYLAGGSVEHADEGADDLFAAGERIASTAPIGGTAHLAGRRISVEGDVGGAVYAAGMDVSVAAPVAGNASLAGYEVIVEGEIGGDVRAFATHVRLSAPVGGYALLAGMAVEIDGEIAGDATVAAEEIVFGPNARVGGQLTVRAPDPAAVEIPASVAPEDRIVREELEDAPQGMRSEDALLAIAGALLAGIVVVTIAVTLIASIAPGSVEALRLGTADGPFRSFGIGFLAMSTLLGAVIVLIATLIGIVVAPALVLAAALGAIAGYLLAVYFVGTAALLAIGQLPPDAFAERALAALVGAILMTLISLIPFVGWLAILALSLTGLGALTIAVLHPRFGREY